MRFERIELDGFGLFHDAGWALDEGLTVVLGENEAGKTTFLNAIRALLFGFEASRDGRAWYPALAGGRRGGRLVLRTADGERWVVERHGERGGGGSLAVRAPSGNQGGQETLDRLLRGADKDLFNNIFAFGLGELQNLHSLSTEGVRARIYGASAGMGGTSAVDLERDLRASLRDVFVPSGSKPPLNDLLGRIERLRAEVAELSRQPEEHAAAHRERDELVTRAEALRAEIRDRRADAARLARLRDAVPVAAELSVVESQLGAADDGLDEFPADAVAVLDRREGELRAARASLDAHDERLTDTKAERARLVVDERLLERAEEIDALVEERMARASAQAGRAELEASEARSAAAVAEQLARAGGWTEDRLMALDDSIATVEATRAHERELTATRLAAGEAERAHQAAAEELELREREGGAVPGGEPAALEAREQALRELDDLRFARATAAASSPWSPGSVIAAAGVAVLAVVTGVMLNAPGAGAVAGVVLGAAAMLAGGRLRGSRAARLARLDQRRAGLLAVAELEQEASDQDVRVAVARLAEELAVRRLSAGQRSTLETRRADLERRAREAQRASEAAAEAERAWRAWLEQHGLPADATPDAARQLLAAAATARRAAAERDAVRARLADLTTADREFAGRAGALLAALGDRPAVEEARRHAQIVAIGARLEAARATRRAADEHDAAIVQLTRRRQPLAATVAERRALVAAHLDALGCGDADLLRRRAAEADARRAVRAKAALLRERLAGIAGGVDAIEALVVQAGESDPAALEALEAEVADQLARLETAERQAMSRIGALEARIDQLEAAEELGTKRQELAALTGQAAAMAREWSVRALTLRLLEETRARYERERQPDVVRAAEAHFSRFTGGRWLRIVAPPGEATVRVEGEGGETRVTDELSRGTAEQLYLALRFGLIEEFALHAEALPVVMDDILVNFDARRAARAAAAIGDLSARHQVIYFTCHPATAELLDPGGARTLALG